MSNRNRVSDYMTADVIHTVSRGSSVVMAAQSMSTAHCGSLLVVSKGRLIGIVTERDLVRRVIARGRSFRSTLVSQVMTSPVITTSPNSLLSDAAKLMLKNHIRRLPVTKGGEIVGMLTTTDLAANLYELEESTQLAAIARAEYQTILE